MNLSLVWEDMKGHSSVLLDEGIFWFMGLKSSKPEVLHELPLHK